MTVPPDPTPSADDARAAKREVRTRLRAARASRDEAQRYAAASGLAVRVAGVPEVAALVDGGDGCVAAYASLPDEPGTDALRSLLALSGVRVLLPVIRDDGLLDWGWDADDLVPREHRLAVREPAVDPGLGTGAPGLVAGRCRVVLVPALAVDLRGYRLGQGGGFYDRLLSDVPAAEVGGPLRVAVVHDDEVLETLPHEPHDRRMDAVLTPTAYRRLR